MMQLVFVLLKWFWERWRSKGDIQRRCSFSQTQPPLYEMLLLFTFKQRSWMCTSLFIITFKLYQMTGPSDAGVGQRFFRWVSPFCSNSVARAQLLHSRIPINFPRLDCRVPKLQLRSSVILFLLKMLFFFDSIFWVHTLESWYCYFGAFWTLLSKNTVFSFETKNKVFFFFSYLVLLSCCLRQYINMYNTMTDWRGIIIYGIQKRHNQCLITESNILVMPHEFSL